MTFKTSFSFRGAVGLPKDIVPLLKELNFEYAPIADISSTFAWYDWKDECEKSGLKPVYGVSLFVTDNLLAKKPKTDLWTFYAIDNIESVTKLVRLATSQFRYTANLTYEQALEAEGVIKITGSRTQKEFMRPVDNLYISVSPSTPYGLLRQFPEDEYNYIQFQSNVFPTSEDELWAETSGGRFFSNQTYDQHILTDEEWEDSLWTLHLSKEQIETCKANWNKAMESCNATLQKADLLRPKMDKTLREMCIEGAEKLGVDLSDPVYSERLETELKVIEDKGFNEYFYIVADMIQWARSRQLVGPGRGSAAGSLVCYLLQITAVDPIKHNLLFFRFLDPQRLDSADIDFDTQNREEVIEYLISKYGSQKVAKLGTFGNFQNKNATNEVSKALGINKFEIENVLNILPKYAANDKRNETSLSKAFEVMDAGKKFIEKYPNFEVVTKMIGTPSHAATHASGVLITDKSLDHYTSVDSRTNTSMIDLSKAEEYGLIKYDILGLKTLEILYHTLQIAGLPLDHFEGIDLNDPKVFQVLNDKKFLGIFQFEGNALRQLSEKIKVDNFEDFAILSALSRPGAADGADAWVARKQGLEEPDYYDPLLEPYLKDTLGALPYQETTMLIANEVADMDWGKVNKLRKAISKSMGSEAMAEFADPFIEGLIRKGVDEKAANRLWQDILKAGAYQFNRAHSIAYGMVSYWTAYVKAYYPVEFAAAVLSLEGDHEKMLELLRELDKEGIKYIPIDPEYSTDKWRVVNGKLIGSLTLIDGIGPKMVQQILSARARDEELTDRAKKLLTNPKTKIDSLYPIQAAIDNMDLKALNILSTPTKVEDVKPDGFWQDSVVMIGVVETCTIKDENEEKRIQDRISRGQEGFINGQSNYVDVRLKDDTGVIFAKIGRKDYEELWPMLDGNIENDKTIICVSGTVPPEISMLLVKRLKIIGSL